MDRCAADASQDGRFFDNGIGLEWVTFAEIKPAALEQTLHSLNPLTQHILVGAFSRRLPEQAGKVIGTEADLLS